VKLRIPLLAVLAIAGSGASYALADGGHGHHHGGPGGPPPPPCRHAHLVGTIAPQTLTVTVTKSGPDGAFGTGQTATITIGSAGQLVRLDADGCSTGSTLTVSEAELHAVPDAPPGPGPGHHHGDDGNGDGQTTTGGGATVSVGVPTTTATTTTTAATTTSAH